MSKVRIIHGSPDAPAVDIWVDGKVAVEHLEFPNDTGYVELPAGRHKVAVSKAGTENIVLGPMDAELAERENYTVIALGLASGQPKLQVKLLHDAA